MLLMLLYMNQYYQLNLNLLVEDLLNEMFDRMNLRRS